MCKIATGNCRNAISKIMSNSISKRAKILHKSTKLHQISGLFIGRLSSSTHPEPFAKNLNIFPRHAL